MKRLIFISTLVLLSISLKSFSQPYADIISVNVQTFSTSYLNPSQLNVRTNDVFVNLFIPKEFKNGNAFLLRLNGEGLNTNVYSPLYPGVYTSTLKSVSMPIGFKFTSGNKKWETIVMGIPKIASDFKDNISSKDLQFGGIFLQHFVPNEKLKIKAGLYYNREAFGNFFVPLVGVDWKATDRIYFYGIMPTSYRVEFNILKEKLYAGLAFKSLTRSFSLSERYGPSYVRYDEMQIKAFVDWFTYKKILLFGEVGYSIGKSPLQYDKYDIPAAAEAYSPTNNYMLFNIGIAYRVRLDLEKKE